MIKLPLTHQVFQVWLSLSYNTHAQTAAVFHPCARFANVSTVAMTLCLDVPWTTWKSARWWYACSIALQHYVTKREKVVGMSGIPLNWWSIHFDSSNLIHIYTCCWFQIICLVVSPLFWGRWTHFDDQIFQWGWFNHQVWKYVHHKHHDISARPWASDILLGWIPNTINEKTYGCFRKWLYPQIIHV